jgi:hypothetical protein
VSLRERFIAYKITHTASGRSYIGITQRELHVRWAAHCRQGKGRIGPAIKKYGRDEFVVEHVASATGLIDLLALERQLIAQDNTIVPNGFNLCGGGEGVLNPSAITRERMSQSASKRTGRVMTPETRAKIAASLRGKEHTADRRANHVAARKRSPAVVSDETREKLSAIRRGRKMPPRSPETIEKIASAHRGKKMKPRSAEWRAKISFNSSNRSAETRAKMSAGVAAYWRRRRESTA